MGKICIGLSIFSSTVGFESSCSSPNELAIRGKETKRLSGSRLSGVFALLSPGTSQRWLLPEDSPLFHLPFFFPGMLLGWELRRHLLRVTGKAKSKPLWWPDA